MGKKQRKKQAAQNRFMAFALVFTIATASVFWALLVSISISNCTPPASWNNFGYFILLDVAYDGKFPSESCDIKREDYDGGAAAAPNPDNLTPTAVITGTQTISEDFGCWDSADIYIDNNVQDPEKVPDSPYSMKDTPFWPGATIAFSQAQWSAKALSVESFVTQYAAELADTLYWESGENSWLKLEDGRTFIITSDETTLDWSKYPVGPEDAIVTIANMEGYRYYAWQAQLEEDLRKAAKTGCLVISTEADIDFEAFKDVDVSDDRPIPKGTKPDGGDIPGDYPLPGEEDGGGIGPTPTMTVTLTTTPMPATADPVDAFLEASGVLDFVTRNEARKAFTGGKNGAWFEFDQPINIHHLINIEGPYPSMLYDISPKGVIVYKEGWWAYSVAKQDDIPLVKMRVTEFSDLIEIPGTPYRVDLRRHGYIEIRWTSRSNDATAWLNTVDNSWEVPWARVYVWPCRTTPPTATPIPIPPTNDPSKPPPLLSTAVPTQPPTPTPWPTPFFIPGGGMLIDILDEYIESGKAVWTCNVTQDGEYPDVGKKFAKFTCFGVEYSVYPMEIVFLADTVKVVDYIQACAPFNYVHIGKPNADPSKDIYICPAK